MTTTETMLLDAAKHSLALKNAGQWAEAAIGFEQILAVQPDWEHGYGWFNLAECYEELGRIRDAGIAYWKAELFSPTDTNLVGGRASFLYLHGEPTEAMDQHIRLLSLERMHPDETAADTTMIALSALSERLGWSGDQLAKHIEKRLQEIDMLTPDS
jgi:tetratricopeptide (TPR) repeat protein